MSKIVLYALSKYFPGTSSLSILCQNRIRTCAIIQCAMSETNCVTCKKRFLYHTIWPIVRLYSTITSVKQLNFHPFSFIILRRWTIHGILLAYVTVIVQSQSCSSICFRDGLHSNSTLWMRWSNSGVYTDSMLLYMCTLKTRWDVA